MSSMARAFGRVPRIAAFALVLMFGVLSAKANDSSVWAVDRRARWTLIGVLTY